MSRFLLYSLLTLSAAPIMSAGQVYGTLRDAAGKGIPGIQITVISPAKVSYETKTGADGSYQVFVKETGKCELHAKAGAAAAATANVFSYAEPAKYEFELVDGKLKVK